MTYYEPYTGQQADRVNGVFLPISAFLGILITYLPLRSFWQHSNVPAISIVFVTVILNLFTFINAIIWPTDDFSTWWGGYGLCDLQGLLRFPITFALAFSLCALSKGLADCLDTDSPCIHQTAATRRRKIIVDVVFCWAVPVHQLVLHYVVQSGRYAIYPVFGCIDMVDNSWPTVLIIDVWAPIITLATLYYAVLLLIRLRKHRRTISRALSTTNSGLAARKYIKLALITLSLILIYVPVQFIFISYVLPTSLLPYSWTRIHSGPTWDVVQFVHTEDTPTQQYRGWAGVATAWLLWAFFGFGEDAVDTYRCWGVQLGLGYIWPSLEDSRRVRFEREISRRGSAFSEESRTSRLDLVGKVMKYFDGDLRRGSEQSGGEGLRKRSSKNMSRKNSDGTTISGFSNETSTTRQSGIFMQRAYSTTSHPIALADLSPSPPTSNPQIHASDFANNFASTSTTKHLSTIPTPRSPTPPFTSRWTPFSSFTFRTHLNISTTTFSHSASTPLHIRQDTSTQVLSQTANDKIDIEAQHPSSTATSQTQIFPPSSSVGTNIWSDNYTPITTLAQPQSAHTRATTPSYIMNSTPVSVVGDGEYEDDDGLGDLDPHAPKMGTRAYRERERREMVKARKVERELEVVVKSVEGEEQRKGKGKDGEVQERRATVIADFVDV